MRPMGYALAGLVIGLVSMPAGAAPPEKPPPVAPPAGLKAAVPSGKAKGGEVKPVLDRRVALGPGGVLVLRGKGLGKAPAGRVVVLRPAKGNRVLLRVRRWTPTRIEAALPAALARRPLRGRLHLARRSSPDRPVSNVIPVALRPALPARAEASPKPGAVARGRRQAGVPGGPAGGFAAAPPHVSAPAAAGPRVVRPPGTLTMTGLGGSRTIRPAGTLTMTGLGGSRTITPSGTLTMTGLGGTRTVTPSGTLTMTGLGGSRTVTPAGTLTMTGLGKPSVRSGGLVVAPAGTLTMTGLGGSRTITPPGTLTMTGLGGSRTIRPSGTLTMTGLGGR